MDGERQEGAEETGSTLSGGGSGLRRATEPSAKEGEELLEVGAVVGRYVVSGRLGQGAMGVVYEAYDAELDRRIALKVVGHQHRHDVIASSRLVREAQALARLSHPNVVQVHEVGAVGTSMYIAMELVRGQTLREWLDAGPRLPRAILEILLAAGTGLAAAHRAGIVHRDVKPTNLVIGEDGRVRMIDFGLAKSVAEAAPASEPVTVTPHITLSRDVTTQASLTEAHAIVGTPAYMAPEQLTAKEVDARTDQFAFALIAWRSLYGVAPFGGRTTYERLLAIEGGPTPPPRQARRVPGHVQRVLTRALASSPAARYPSMDALLADLGRDVVTRRRWMIAIGGSALLAGGTVAAVLSAASPRAAAAEPCTGAARALEAVWTPTARATMSRAFAASGRPDATELFDHATRALDGYAASWRRARIDTCRATHVDQTQSAELLDARMRCLDDHLDQLRTLVGLYQGPTAAAGLGQVVKAVLGLPAAVACSDAHGLATRAPLPADPTTRAAVVTASSALARGKALRLAARFDEARTAVEAVVPQARRLGYMPLVADALYELAAINDALGANDDSRRWSFEALEAAARAGDPTLETLISAGLIWTIGYRQEHFAEAEILERTAAAALIRAGDPPLPRAQLLHCLGGVHILRGDVDRASAELREALALRERVIGGDDLRIAYSLEAVAFAVQQARPDEAITHAERALAMRERLFGPHHPELAYSLSILGAAHVAAGRPARALPLARRAVAVREAVLGPDHSLTGWAHWELAGVELALDDHAAARASLERAATILAPEIVPGTVSGGAYRLRLGQLQLAGHDPAARATLRQAVADLEQTAPTNPDLLAARRALASAERDVR